MDNDHLKDTNAANANLPLTKRERRRLKREAGRQGYPLASGESGRHHYWLWLGVLLVLAATVYGLYYVATHRQPVTPTSSTLADPVVASDWRQGPAEAPVTLVEYSDFQCPACGFYAPWVQELEQDFPKELAVIYRHFPLTQLHLNAAWAARAAEAAGLQGKFWEMHDQLFDQQKAWSEQLGAKAIFAGYARKLGLNVAKFNQDLNGKVTKAAVDDDIESGQRSGIIGTPSFFLDGKLITNPASYEDFANLIRQIANPAAASVASSTNSHDQ